MVIFSEFAVFEGRHGQDNDRPPTPATPSELLLGRECRTIAMGAVSDASCSFTVAECEKLAFGICGLFLIGDLRTPEKNQSIDLWRTRKAEARQGGRLYNLGPHH